MVCKRFLITLTIIISTHIFVCNSASGTMPKAELHLHLGGAYPLDFLSSIASHNQIKQLTDSLKLISQGITYNKIFDVFKLVSDIVNTHDKVEAGTFALCQSLQNDGVTYAEIRTGLKNFGKGLECYLQSVLKGIDQGRCQNFQAYLLLSLQRASTPEIAKQTVDLALKYKDKGVIGIDISGDSTAGDIQTIVPELLRAQQNGLFLTIHLGESPNERDQKKILEVLQPNRIGHGVFLEPEALKWILDHKTPIEVCLSSSIIVQMTDAHKNHPFLHHHRNCGHPIVLCTDDPLLFSTTLSKEFEILDKTALFSKQEINEIAQNGFTHAFYALDCKKIFVD